METGTYDVIAHAENHAKFKFTYREFVDWFCKCHFTCYSCPLYYASFRYKKNIRVPSTDKWEAMKSGDHCPTILANLDPHSEQYNRYLGEVLETIKDSSNYTIFEHKSKAPLIARAINYVISSVEMFLYNLTKGGNSNGS